MIKNKLKKKKMRNVNFSSSNSIINIFFNLKSNIEFMKSCFLYVYCTIRKGNNEFQKLGFQFDNQLEQMLNMKRI